MRLKYDYYLLNKKQEFIVHYCPKTGPMFGCSILILICLHFLVKLWKMYIWSDFFALHFTDYNAHKQRRCCFWSGIIRYSGSPNWAFIQRQCVSAFLGELLILYIYNLAWHSCLYGFVLFCFFSWISFLISKI